MAVFIGAGQTVQRILGDGSLDRPFKRIDRTHNQHRRVTVPAYLPQNALAVLRRLRFERPSGIGTQFGRHSKLTKNCARFFVPRDHQRILAVAAAHLGNQRIHVAGFRAVANGQLVFHGGDPERANHHRCQGIGKLALEHRTFAGHHAVMLWHFVRQEWREDIRQMYLLRAFEVPFGKVKILAHHAEVNALRAQDVTDLPQHLVDANIGAHISGAVVSGKQQLELLSRLPGLISAQHPSGFGALDVAAHPGFENEVHHAAVPPLAAGHGWYWYSKLFSRLNFSRGKLYCENGTGFRPSSDVTRVLSNTVFQTRYGINTFINDAP